jgi:hypothetical protein
MSPTPPVSLTDWVAGDLGDLRSIWESLRPDLDAADTERTFRGRPLTPQQAGDVFERWVMEAFRLSGARGGYAYRVPLRGSGSTREQIDGLLFDGWQGFLVESKFWTDKASFGPIALLHLLVEQRPVGVLGLFFSAFGYTVPAVESAELLHPIRVLLFDRQDLTWALGSTPFAGRMAEMVRRKWMHAVKYGRPYGPASDPPELFA